MKKKDKTKRKVDVKAKTDASLIVILEKIFYQFGISAYKTNVAAYIQL